MRTMGKVSRKSWHYRVMKRVWGWDGQAPTLPNETMAQYWAEVCLALLVIAIGAVPYGFYLAAKRLLKAGSKIEVVD